MKMAESTDHKVVCSSRDCLEEAVKYCSTCRQIFCPTHDKIHQEFLTSMNTVHEVVTIEQYQKTKRERKSRYCDRHRKSAISLACSKCYQPLCIKCVDDAELMKCKSAIKDHHDACSVAQVSQNIKEDMSNLLSELRIRDMTISDSMKEKRQLFDEQMEEHRDDLEKLEAKVEELHEMINTRHKEWKETLVEHMTSKRDLMHQLEAEFDDYQKHCQEIYDTASQIKQTCEVSIVKDWCGMKTKLDPLIRFELNRNYEKFTKLPLLITDKPVKLPIFFQTANSQSEKTIIQEPQPPRVPSSLSITEEINTPSHAFCVSYNQDGRLLHSGSYPPSERKSVQNLQIMEGRYNMTLFEHRSSLYIQQWFKGSFHIHHVNQDDEFVSLSIITFPSGGSFQQMTANDELILIADSSNHLIKVYSTKTHYHLLDMKDNSVFKSPWGLAVLDEGNLLVGDYENSRVVNMTIGCAPKVHWTCSAVKKPRAIQPLKDSQIVLVGSYYNHIYILSYQGMMLKKLPTIQSSGIFDISAHGNKLAITDGTCKIKVYEIKYNKPTPPHVGGH